MSSHCGLRKRHTRFVPRLEALEDRCCPAAIEVSGNTLTIIGDSTDNAVTIRDDGSGVIDATITGVGAPVTGMATGISTFVIYTQGGFDTINYSRGTTIQMGWSLGPAAYQVTLNVIATGGSGAFVLATVQPGFAPVVPVVDLTWTDGGITAPSTVLAQTEFIVSRTYTVSNTAAPFPFTIAYYGSVDDVFGNADDFLLATEVISAAADRAVGSHSGGSPALQLTVPGTYFLFARLDDAGQITEADEANNVAPASLPVVVAAPPVVDLSWSGGGLVAPASVTAGVAFTLTRTYAVSGVAAPAGFAIAYYGSVDDVFGNEDDFFLTEEAVNKATDLAPGTHPGVSPSLVIGTPGSYFLFALLDPRGEVAEGNEANNLFQTLEPVLVNPPDPSV